MLNQRDEPQGKPWTQKSPPRRGESNPINQPHSGGEGEAPAALPMEGATRAPMIDGCQRKIEYLRLSVTDLCNLRCYYCMPLEGILKKEREEILTFEEMNRLVRIFAELGLKRVRVTGGEPLVRKGIVELIGSLKKIAGIEEVLLTTNGILLKSLAHELKEAGLTRINIHLDTLSPEKFRTITRGGEIERVFEGIEEAKKAGFSPLKLNAVIQRGFNDEEIENLLRFAAEKNLVLRLIELMPIGISREASHLFVSLQELRRRLEEKFTLLLSPSKWGRGPAIYYHVKELNTDIGFISPVSQPFCSTCNRIRISSDGRFQDCLAYDGSFSLRDLLRTMGISDAAIAENILQLLRGKRESHNDFTQEEGVRTPCMYGIGG